MEHPDRKLAAILSADAVGYSRLMAADEAATVRTITTYREEISSLVREHRGRVVDAPGDNLLAEFPTALDAVEAAAEIQRVIEARNAGLPEERRMPFRIGVHLGDVSTDGGRLYGDGVNIAARLESLAPAGGICISAAVRDQVRSRLDVEIRDRGAQQVKNIPEPVHVFELGTSPAPIVRSLRRPLLAGSVLLVIAALVALGWLRPWQGSGAGGSQGLAVIAVLPFDNMSGDPEQEYFADGLSEDLITRLSAWRGARVIARNSTFVYKGEAVDVGRVSQELGARYVVEGSVRRAGDRVRVNAQLIDSGTSHHVWAETYDRELRDVFVIQDEITRAITASVQGQVEKSEIERARQLDPRGLDALDLVLRADGYRFRMVQADNEQARVLYQRALEIEPGFTRAHAGLARAHWERAYFGWTGDFESTIEQASRHAQTAVALDPDDASAHATLASIYYSQGRWEETEASARRALALNPSSLDGYTWLGWALVYREEHEQAMAAFGEALELSPRGPLRWVLLDGMAGAYFGAGRYAEAVEWTRQVVRYRPDYFWSYVRLASAHAHLGQLDEARAQLEKALEIEPDLSVTRVEQLLGGMPYTEATIAGLRSAGWEG